MTAGTLWIALLRLLWTSQNRSEWWKTLNNVHTSLLLLELELEFNINRSESARKIYQRNEPFWQEIDQEFEQCTSFANQECSKVMRTHAKEKHLFHRTGRVE